MAGDQVFILRLLARQVHLGQNLPSGDLRIMPHVLLVEVAAENDAASPVEEVRVVILYLFGPVCRGVHVADSCRNESIGRDDHVQNELSHLSSFASVACIDSSSSSRRT